MSDMDIFIKKLENDYDALTSFKKEGSDEKEIAYLSGKLDAIKEIRVELKKAFDVDCRYIVINKNRTLDNCTLKKYCDPRNCSLKECRE